MNLVKEATEIISTFGASRLYVECPCCGEPILLRTAGLFYLDNFSPQAQKLYQLRLEALKEQHKELRERRKAISQTSEIGAKAVNIGFILERIAPSMKKFPYDKHDCRSLFDPIDYVIFEGLSSKGFVSKILFVDIKTGGSRLKTVQKEIRQLVQSKCVVWDTYETETTK